MKMTCSLQERLSMLPPGPEDDPFQRETIGRFFQAVGLITHMPYPLQRLEQIKKLYQITERQPYLSVLSLALRDAASEEWPEEGERLLEHMFIEPLAAIHQAFQEVDKNDYV